MADKDSVKRDKNGEISETNQWENKFLITKLFKSTCQINIECFPFKKGHYSSKYFKVQEDNPEQLLMTVYASILISGRDVF